MNYLLGLQGYNPTTTSIKYLVETKGMTEVEATLHNSLFTNVLGIFVYNMNVIGGIIAGVFGVILHNKFRQVELHPSLTFYSGKRFVPIITALIMPFIGMVLVFIWPVINNIIMKFGSIIANLNILLGFSYMDS